MNRQTIPVIALLSVHALLLAWSGYSHSPTWDEGAHLPAGISHWRTGEFDLYRVNPPLVRMVAAIPMSVAQPRFDFYRDVPSPTLNINRDASVAFFRLNSDRIRWLYAIARWACIPFSVVGGLVCWAWASRLYGAIAGILSLALWCVCPNILGHGHLITPDVGAAAVGVAAAYFFWRWLNVSTTTTAVLAGVLLGLAELSKTTWLVFVPLWPVLTLFWWLTQPDDFRQRLRARLVQLASILLIALYVLNLGYAFEGSFVRLGDYTFLSHALRGSSGGTAGQPSGGNRFAGSVLGYLPVPLPSNYVRGIDRQKSNFEREHYSYLRGQWRNRGWYFYYAYAMLIKVPLGTWCIGLLATAVSICPRRFLASTTPQASDRDAFVEHDRFGSTRGATWRDEVIVLAPALIVLLLVSSETGFNRHLRYVLPAFPFLFIWSSKVARELTLTDFRAQGVTSMTVLSASATTRRRVLAILVAAAVGWSAASSLFVYPHSLSYFNELVGGPTNGHLHLNSSNVDWGQDLWYAKSWYEEHPEARPLHFHYRLKFVDLSITGIEHEPVPAGPVMNRRGAPATSNWPWRTGNTGLHQSSDGNSCRALARGPLPGWYIVSLSDMHSLRGHYEYFQEFEPVDRIGYSMNVYHITPRQADSLRDRFTLPPQES